MKVTTTVIVEIKDVKHELTQAEAKQLLAALSAAVGDVRPSVFGIDSQKRQFKDQWLDKLDLRCGVAEAG
jgi:hypothetical protein